MIDHNTPYIKGPGPVTPEECDALIREIAATRHALGYRAGPTPNALILSNRQFCALKRFGKGTFAVYQRPNGHNEFLAMNIIVDARGDYPNTPLVGHIEF